MNRGSLTAGILAGSDVLCGTELFTLPFVDNVYELGSGIDFAGGCIRAGGGVGAEGGGDGACVDVREGVWAPEGET